MLRPAPEQWADWKWQFHNRLTSLTELARIVPMAPDLVRRLDEVAVKFPLSTTPHYPALVRDGDADDPILLQSIPDVRESDLGHIGHDDR